MTLEKKLELITRKEKKYQKDKAAVKSAEKNNSNDAFGGDKEKGGSIVITFAFKKAAIMRIECPVI